MNPNDLIALDQLTSTLKINRSQIIRDAVAATANVYTRVISLLESSQKPSLKAWLELAGAEKSKSGNLGLRVDEIYND